jgi:hypothetical protein
MRNPSEWQNIEDVLEWVDHEARSDNLYIAVDLHRVLDPIVEGLKDLASDDYRGNQPDYITRAYRMLKGRP